MTMNGTTLKMAMELDARYACGYAEWLDACEGDYKNGYRPSQCEHGTNNWTDYDNICGLCEEGITMGDPLIRMRAALDEAKSRWTSTQEIVKAWNRFRDLGLGDAVDVDKVTTRISQLLHV
jgi:hypothetical protein